LNEEKYIADCIDSILVSGIVTGETEIIFVDGGSHDQTVNMIHGYIQTYPMIKILHNPKKYTPISINMGIKASTGEYIFILSAHAGYEKGYFKNLVQASRELEADCVGGVLTTEAKNKNKKSNAIKEVLTHRFGVGNASFRTGSSTVKEVDTVAFGCYRKSAFDTYGLFDERLIRNQDIELNKRIVNGGGKIYLVPGVRATYYARENFMDLAKNSYANGFWNILTAYYTKKLSSLSARHFVPLLFVLSVLMPIVLSLLYAGFLWIALLSLGSYLCLVIIISSQMKSGDYSKSHLVKGFLILHIAYGIGSLMGLFSILNKYIKGEK
jgi:glycosyltransferase involved in cell wall biosynthesis